MNRTAVLSTVAAGALAALASLASGQGVPVTDQRSFTERLQAFLHLERDEDTQVQKANNRADIRDFERQQVETLDAMIEAFSSVSSFQQTFVASGAGIASVEEVYGPLANPSGQYVFGDAREDVEDYIIRGSQDTYTLPGVGMAGLSPVQWRCLLQALVWQESRFVIDARSSAEAFGLTQIIPGTAQDLGIYPEYYEDPYLQVVGGARYLARQLERFDGNVIHALAAYNAGPGRVIEYGGVPPFQETQHYVQVIPARYNAYLQSVGGVEARGTIDPAEYAVSNASLMSNGSIYYAENAMAAARQALERVRELVVQIGESPTVTASYDLNTMMRAEIVFLVNSMIRTRAARTQAEYAQVAAQLAGRREAMAFLDFTPTDFQ